MLDTIKSLEMVLAENKVKECRTIGFYDNIYTVYIIMHCWVDISKSHTYILLSILFDIETMSH